MKINWKWLFRGMVALLVSCIGVYWGSMTWLKVNELDVVLPKMPADLSGLRILQISDLHSNNEKKMNLDIWKTVDALDFDIAVMTGDMVTGEFEELTPHMEKLAALAARVPTFFVMGNHDYWHYHKMKRFMESIGVTVLADSFCEVEYNGEMFTMIGTLDGYHYRRNGGFDSLHEMMAEAGEGFRIVLTHQPQVFDELKSYAPDFVVAGHTHGGQLRLPFLPTLYAPGQGLFPKYGDGFYTDEATGAQLYISRGIGTTTFPIRFYNRPEITVFTLLNED